MSTKPRVLTLLDKRLGRRVTIAPLVLVGSVVGVVISPLILLVAVARDLLQQRRRLPTFRITLFIIGALVIETGGMAVSFITWVSTGFGHLGTLRWRWQMHRWAIGWYTRSMLTLITRVLGTKIVWRDHADLSTGPVICIARHTSFFDAVIPGAVLCQRNKLLAHHIVTHGLRYSPCIDIVGHRVPTRFIKRTPGEGSGELVHIEEVGQVLDDRSAAIIFPEGTFRNPARFERQIARIGRRRPDMADRARSLQHVLPPRTHGTYALLHGAPTADIVICTNTGFESFGTIKDIISHPFTDTPIVVETWRIPRDQVPQEPDAFNDWLFDQYVIIDNWVSENADPGLIETG